MKFLDAKNKEVEDLHDWSFQIKSELSKVSEKLYNTKLELSKHHSESESTASELKRLKSALVNQNMQ